MDLWENWAAPLLLGHVRPRGATPPPALLAQLDGPQAQFSEARGSGPLRGRWTAAGEPPAHSSVDQAWLACESTAEGVSDADAALSCQDASLAHPWRRQGRPAGARGLAAGRSPPSASALRDADSEEGLGQDQVQEHRGEREDPLRSRRTTPTSVGRQNGGGWTRSASRTRAAGSWATSTSRDTSPSWWPSAGTAWACWRSPWT